jgi:hypothetical protein
MTEIPPKMQQLRRTKDNNVSTQSSVRVSVQILHRQPRRDQSSLFIRAWPGVRASTAAKPPQHSYPEAPESGRIQAPVQQWHEERTEARLSLCDNNSETLHPRWMKVWNSLQIRLSEGRHSRQNRTPQWSPRSPESQSRSV